MAISFDTVDLVLLSVLQRQGRVSQHELSRVAGLSAPAVAERLRKLEERGVIRQYTTILDAHMLGLDVTAFISVGIDDSKHFAQFRDRVDERPEILECHSVTGEGSHLLKVRVENTGALEVLLAELQSWPGVRSTTTSIALSTQKETTVVPLAADAAGDVQGVAMRAASGAASHLLRVPFRHHT
jgi:Lrp/AsnC family transcriptional regulator, leucine-responsive regulatory protein